MYFLQQHEKNYEKIINYMYIFESNTKKIWQRLKLG